jgi:hypothetical protein
MRDLPSPAIGKPDNVIFLSNAVLCLKQGSMNSNVPYKFIAVCGQQFLRPLLGIVRPKVVATLGWKALWAAHSAYPEIGIDWTRTLRVLVERGDPYLLPPGQPIISDVSPKSTGFRQEAYAGSTKARLASTSTVCRSGLKTGLHRRLCQVLEVTWPTFTTLSLSRGDCRHGRPTRRVGIIPLTPVFPSAAAA